MDPFVPAHRPSPIRFHFGPDLPDLLALLPGPTSAPVSTGRRTSRRTSSRTSRDPSPNNNFLSPGIPVTDSRLNNTDLPPVIPIFGLRRSLVQIYNLRASERGPPLELKHQVELPFDLHRSGGYVASGNRRVPVALGVGHRDSLEPAASECTSPSGSRHLTTCDFPSSRLTLNWDSEHLDYKHN